MLYGLALGARLLNQLLLGGLAAGGGDGGAVANVMGRDDPLHAADDALGRGLERRGPRIQDLDQLLAVGGDGETRVARQLLPGGLDHLPA